MKSVSIICLQFPLYLHEYENPLPFPVYNAVLINTELYTTEVCVYKSFGIGDVKRNIQMSGEKLFSQRCIDGLLENGNFIERWF